MAKANSGSGLVDSLTSPSFRYFSYACTAVVRRRQSNTCACFERTAFSGAEGQFRKGKNSSGLYFCRRHEARRLGGGGNSYFRAHQLFGEEPGRAPKEGGLNEGRGILLLSNTVRSRGYLYVCLDDIPRHGLHALQQDQRLAMASLNVDEELAIFVRQSLFNFFSQASVFAVAPLNIPHCTHDPR